MSDPIIPEFSPVQAAEAVKQPAIAEVVNDTWALDYQHIRRYKADGVYKFELHTIWALGRMTSAGVWTEAEKEQKKTVVITDMLSAENLTANPEIAAIGPPFFANLAILCKRLGNL
jgi:hypothetical protein